MDKCRGWAFPVEVEPLTGRVKEVTGAEAVRQSIKMILNTNMGERPYYRDFGCGLRGYVFGLTNYTTLKQIEHEVKTHISKWEKRIELLNVQASSNGMESVHVDIEYKITDTGASFHYRHDLDMR